MHRAGLLAERCTTGPDASETDSARHICGKVHTSGHSLEATLRLQSRPRLDLFNRSELSPKHRETPPAYEW